MFAFLRFAVLAALILGLIYGIVWLAKESWRRSPLLPVLIFGLPICLVALIVYRTNFM